MPNTKLAYAALDAARANPKSFNMGAWIADRDYEKHGGADLWDSDELVTVDTLQQPGCGTTVCFAGWACAVNGDVLQVRNILAIPTRDGAPSADIERRATALLDLDLDQAENLFYCNEDEIEGKVAEIFGPRPDPDPTPAALAEALLES